MSGARRKGERLDLASVRERLRGSRGREYWRSLEEVAATEEFRAYLGAEFPEQASAWSDPIGRRDFLRLMAASLALAGATACSRQPPEEIVPYRDAPEGLVPGKPLFFATALALTGPAVGVLVESHMGRPTKVEGNPLHPASLGATDIFAQAAVLGLYDPERSQVVTESGRISTWSAFAQAVGTALAIRKPKQGAGVRLLTGDVTSPTLAAQIQEFLADAPRAGWHVHDPVLPRNTREGSRLAFGRELVALLRPGRADVVLALDADFLDPSQPGGIRHAKELAGARRLAGGRTSMNRLYCVESSPTLTGSKADHRLPLRPSQVAPFLDRLAALLDLGPPPGAQAPSLGGEAARWLPVLARELRGHRGSSLLVAGEPQPPRVHAVVHHINGALGNAGSTVDYVPSPVADLERPPLGLAELVADMAAGRVEVLVVLDANPAYSAPADLDFARALSEVGLKVRMGLYEDETSALCDWHAPRAHPLESWGDERALDGTLSVVQPLIAPLYEGRTPHELLSVLSGRTGRAAREIVRSRWVGVHGEEGFDRFWEQALRDGVVPGTASRPVSVAAAPPPPAEPASPDGLELSFRPDPTVWDGRYANLAWLQELPKPLTKLTWDNAAWLSPADAARLGTSNGDVVRLRAGGESVEAPVWVMPGHAEGAVTVHLGYGRTKAGRVGDGAGFDAYRLRTDAGQWWRDGLSVEPTGGRRRLASTQHHHSMEGRHLVRHATLEEYRRDPRFPRDEPEKYRPTESLYEPYLYEGHAWGMTIDLGACIGCNACVLACQAENNIPVVGREQVGRGREMHWIRVDRWYRGDLERPETFFEPVPCMHCENAPCELVCPVMATLHDSEGLNVMVYNRCVGTRYCSNNCPYKVRRFNFLQFSDAQTPQLALLRNPDVTVRSRGVMEKCSYCLQRISKARIQAEEEDRRIRDGDIVTACQQACPTEAIVFGDVNDRSSRVAAMKAEPRNYLLLGELNTRPRTSYLAEVRNPNPDLAPPPGRPSREG